MACKLSVASVANVQRAAASNHKNFLLLEDAASIHDKQKEGKTGWVKGTACYPAVDSKLPMLLHNAKDDNHKQSSVCAQKLRSIHITFVSDEIVPTTLTGRRIASGKASPLMS
jgi:hypothetical protein